MKVWLPGEKLDPSHPDVELVKSNEYAMWQDRQGLLYVTDSQGIVQSCGRDLSSAEQVYQRPQKIRELENE